MKEKIFVVVWLLWIFGFLFLHVFLQDQKVSKTERRTLQKAPELSWDRIQNRKVMEELDAYTLDQFPLRDAFRSLKSHTEFSIFGKLDNNKIYIEDDMIFKSEYPTNEESIEKWIKKMNQLKETYFKNNQVYYAIVPDKNYYAKDSFHLNLDYNLLYDKVRTGIQTIHEIDLLEVLTLEDYYYTDTHWKQERLQKVVNEIGDHMNFHIDYAYQKKTYSKFYGVYYGQAALKGKPDMLTYLTNSELDQVKVTNGSREMKVYDTTKLGGMDSYDVFLGGAEPYIEITNQNQKNGRELLLFRDSFGSSLAPLLIPAYSKITLIDLRYMATPYMENLITIKDQDVLLLYSTLIINNSSVLK